MKKIALILTTALAVNSFAIAAEETKQPSTFAKYAKPIAKIVFGLLGGAAAFMQADAFTREKTSTKKGEGDGMNWFEYYSTNDDPIHQKAIDISTDLLPIGVCAYVVKQGIQELIDLRK